MVNVYAVECSSCRIAFRIPQSIFFASDVGVRLQSASTPCVQCGSPCPLREPRREIAPDGTVRYYFGVDPAGDVHDRAIADGLIADIQAAQSAEEAAQIIEQRAPWLAPLAEWLRANNAYAGWLSVVITLVTFFAPFIAEDDPPNPPSTTKVEETLQEILNELRESPTSPPSGTTPGTGQPATEGSTNPQS